jgi:hypothetical protein
MEINLEELIKVKMKDEEELKSVCYDASMINYADKEVYILNESINGLTVYEPLNKSYLFIQNEYLK